MRRLTSHDGLAEALLVGGEDTDSFSATADADIALLGIRRGLHGRVRVGLGIHAREYEEVRRVEEPVASSRVVGKWSAAIFSNSDGLARR